MLRTFLLASAVMTAAALPAFAADTYSKTTTTKTTTYQGQSSYNTGNAYADRDTVAVVPTLKLGAGLYDAFDGEEDTADFKAELHSNFKFLEDFPIIDSVHPFIAAETSSHGGLYLAPGIATDFNLSPSVVLTPSLAFGWYNQGGAKDIGSDYAFRPGIELAYRMSDESKVGVELTSISNWGLADESDSVESITLNYHIPFGVLGTF